MAGLRLDDVFKLFDGLEALPDVLVSVLSVLEELCELCVDAQAIITAWSSPSLESSLESPVNGIERIWDARYELDVKIIIKMLKSFLKEQCGRWSMNLLL